MLKYARITLTTMALAVLLAVLSQPGTPARAVQPTVAHLVTALDDSGSMYKDRPDNHLLNLHELNISAWSQVMRHDMPKIIAESGFDQVIFEAFYWNDRWAPLIPRTVLDARNPGPALNDIADILVSHINKGPDKNRTGSSNTDIRVAYAHGLSLFNTGASHQVLNIVSDDDSDRIMPLATVAYKTEAETRNVTVNVLSIGSRMDSYYITSVKQGPASFLRSAKDTVAWRQKFIRDLF